MSSSQRKAVRAYRSRLDERGLARFEVLGKSSDRELLRRLAKRIAEDDAGAAALRTSITESVGLAEASNGGILAALRASPLVGAELDLSRDQDDGREISF